MSLIMVAQQYREVNSLLANQMIFIPEDNIQNKKAVFKIVFWINKTQYL